MNGELWPRPNQTQLLVAKLLEARADGRKGIGMPARSYTGKDGSTVSVRPSAF